MASNSIDLRNHRDDHWFMNLYAPTFPYNVAGVIVPEYTVFDSFFYTSRNLLSEFRVTKLHYAHSSICMGSALAYRASFGSCLSAESILLAPHSS